MPHTRPHEAKRTESTQHNTTQTNTVSFKATQHNMTQSAATHTAQTTHKQHQANKVFMITPRVIMLSKNVKASQAHRNKANKSRQHNSL